MKKIWDKVYYGIRYPLGWLILQTRNLFFRIGPLGFWWVKMTIKFALWLDQLGVDILPEKAPPDRLEKKQ